MSTLPLEALARAGGGGGGRGGGILTIILLPFILVYLLIRNYLARKKHQEAIQLMLALEKVEHAWGEDVINHIIKETYFKVQQAWTERNQDIAKDYMSPRLYELHRMQTDAMISKGEINVLENVRLLESKVVQVIDCKGTERDAFWAFIRGSMIDYIKNEKQSSGLSSFQMMRRLNHVENNTCQSEEFCELWRFVRSQGPNEWVVDEIRQSADILQLLNMHSTTEG